MLLGSIEVIPFREVGIEVCSGRLRSKVVKEGRIIRDARPVPNALRDEQVYQVIAVQGMLDEG